MNNQIGLGIFGTFGEPHGFQQVFYYGAQFSGSLDLNDAAIEFYPGSELYSVRREIVDGVHSICICIYSYAQELNTTRMGTFLGSCMVLQDGFTEADYIYKVLHSLHHDLMSNGDNVDDQTIKVAQGTDVVIREPAEFVAAQANLIPLNRTPFFTAHVDEEKKYLIIPSPHAFGNTEKEVIDFIDEALKHYSDTGTLYFSFDKNVYEFVRNAGVIPVIEWDDFKDRKSQMQQSTAVRTKKGIQKVAAATDPVIETDTSDTEPDNAYTIDSYKAYSEDEDKHDSSAPYKPFLLWEQPEELWDEEEIKDRVDEYNRLFRYTNTLIDHINEPYPEESKRGRRRVLVAAMLLLLISGSVAVYFFGIYTPVQEPSGIAGAPETPRAVQHNNIITDSIAAVSAVDSSVNAEMAASSENKVRAKHPGVDVSYRDIAADLDALEAKFEDKPATPALINTQASKEVVSSNGGPAISLPIATPGNKPVVSNNGKLVQEVASVHTHTPVPTTPAADVAATEKGIMPDINMPAMPRANLPTSALYSGKPRTEPAYTDFKNITTTTTQPAPAAKPATAAAIAKQGNNVSPAVTTTTTTTPAKTAPTTTQPVANTKTTPATAPSVTATLPIVNTKPVPAVPTQPATAASMAPTALGKAGTSGAALLPVSATPTQPKPVAGVANSVVASVPATATKPLTGTKIGSVTPSQQVSLNATPIALAAKPTTIPATTTQPITPKRDSNKTAATSTPAGNSASTSPFAKAPISSGVSAGEMSRANAVALPQLKTSPDPEQMKLKTLYPRPNGNITQRDIPVLTQTGIKNKTLTQLTQLIMDNAPESVGKYYKGQELQYAAALLNNNRQAFQRVGNDYICTGEYLILHIPAIIKPMRPAVFPK